MTTSDREHGQPHERDPHEREGLEGPDGGSSGSATGGTYHGDGFGDAAGVATGEVIPPPAIADHDLPGEKSSGRAGSGIDLAVTLPAVGLILAVVAWGLLKPEHFANFAETSLTWVVANTGWLFVLAGTVFVFFIVGIALSKFGHIRLGGDAEKPEFSTVSWIAMMFAAGMGIGLMFYGVTEPLTFYRNGVPGHERHEVGTAMATTMFHWTLHPWAVYAIVGLSIAYGTYRLGRRQLISAAFIPLIGVRNAEGVVGKLIDVLAIFATVFGTAASLGLGVLQITAGMEYTGLVSNPGTWLMLGVVIVLGLAFLVSALSGVNKGIQYISNFNMMAALVLAVFVLVAGPTVVILNSIPTAAGSYLAQFFEMAARTGASADGTAGEWLSTWTIFYWAWWISWSPFVGMFLARISRGRTIREFVFSVVLVPSIVSLVWFSIFGGSAIEFERIGQSIWGDGSAEGQLFALLGDLPGGSIAAYVAMILLATFFITSADSASTVMGTMSQNGRLTAARPVTAMWGISTALIAVVLLLTGGEDALSNLQSVTILAASPFLLVVIALMFALVKGLSDDPLYLDEREQRRFALKLARERRIAAAAEGRRVPRPGRNPKQGKTGKGGKLGKSGKSGKARAGAPEK
ncbi:BCCT family transporter [Corynebacterium hansenii]|uniref:BCCT family transporter n=1 Tax=Corynebacterium hansenii TaxID=394964 RepID=A0ABV7ZPU8_9CORY|nr:BCCT family transporter [Corynebacterium hansenii]WJZ00800.1 Glycine betaine transporter BetP [Corynebacterium hansenii]